MRWRQSPGTAASSQARTSARNWSRSSSLARGANVRGGEGAFIGGSTRQQEVGRVVQPGRRPAQQRLVQLGALQEQVAVVLPGEADPAVQLDGVLGDPGVDLA